MNVCFFPSVDFGLHFSYWHGSDHLTFLTVLAYHTSHLTWLVISVFFVFVVVICHHLLMAWGWNLIWGVRWVCREMWDINLCLSAALWGYQPSLPLAPLWRQSRKKRYCSSVNKAESWMSSLYEACKTATVYICQRLFVGLCNVSHFYCVLCTMWVRWRLRKFVSNVQVQRNINHLLFPWQQVSVNSSMQSEVYTFIGSLKCICPCCSYWRGSRCSWPPSWRTHSTKTSILCTWRSSRPSGGLDPMLSLDSEMSVGVSFWTVMSSWLILLTVYK